MSHLIPYFTHEPCIMPRPTILLLRRLFTPKYDHGVVPLHTLLCAWTFYHLPRPTILLLRRSFTPDYDRGVLFECPILHAWTIFHLKLLLRAIILPLCRSLTLEYDDSILFEYPTPFSVLPGKKLRDWDSEPLKMARIEEDKKEMNRPKAREQEKGCCRGRPCEA
jgi:hypothetical protein